MTKDEIKAKIAEITKENTTEALHAEVLNALVDMIGEDSGAVDIDPYIHRSLTTEEFKYLKDRVSVVKDTYKNIYTKCSVYSTSLFDALQDAIDNGELIVYWGSIVYEGNNIDTLSGFALINNGMYEIVMVDL